MDNLKTMKFGSVYRNNESFWNENGLLVKCASAGNKRSSEIIWRKGLLFLADSRSSNVTNSAEKYSTASRISGISLGNNGVASLLQKNFWLRARRPIYAFAL